MSWCWVIRLSCKQSEISLQAIALWAITRMLLSLIVLIVVYPLCSADCLTLLEVTLTFNLSNLGSVQFSRSVVSDSLWHYESQHARPPCPSPTAGVYPDSCPSSRWCHPAISSSVIPFSSCPQSLPAAGSFPVSQLFARGGQSIGVSWGTRYQIHSHYVKE